MSVTGSVSANSNMENSSAVIVNSPDIFVCNNCSLVKFPDVDPENLTSVNLASNNITDISDLPNFPKLETLDLGSNLITYIHWHWFKAPQLKLLDLSNNKITHVSGKFIAHFMPNINVIDLSGNEISSFPKETFLFPTENYASVQLGGNPFHCDARLCWLKQYDEFTWLSEVSTLAKTEPTTDSSLSVEATTVTGYAVASVAFTALVAALLCCLTRYRARRRDDLGLQRALRHGLPLVPNRMYATNSHQLGIQQASRARHLLRPNQMYTTNPTAEQLTGSSETTANQAGSENIEPYEETSLSKIAESQEEPQYSNHEVEHTYTNIIDDQHSVRQIVEANRDPKYVNEAGRYETIPNELGCTGVEPYAEVSLAAIADKSCPKCGSDGSDRTVTEATPVPNTSDADRAAIPTNHDTVSSEETGTLTASEALLATSEVIYKEESHTEESLAYNPALLTNNEGPSDSTGMVYVSSSQDSAPTDAALLSQKNLEERHTQESAAYNTALLTNNEGQPDRTGMVYASSSQDSTPTDAALLSQKNLEESKNAENCSYNVT
ncbi:Transcriptional adapter 1 [Branchiostoma belcheri]|nr:Transcriptional adapter 1 [Branchiostoma belcheri]